MTVSVGLRHAGGPASVASAAVSVPASKGASVPASRVTSSSPQPRAKRASASRARSICGEASATCKLAPMDEIDAMKPKLFQGLVGALMSPEWQEIERTKKQVAALQTTASIGSDAAARVNALTAKVEALEENLLGLGLYTRTILQLLVEAEVVTLDAFAEKLKEIDLLDGKLDGK